MGVLHKYEFVAFDGKFREPVHHRKDAVMVARRNGFEKPGPCRLGCRQREGGRAGIGGDLRFDEIEDRRSLPDLIAKHTAHGPAHVASTASAAQAARQAKALGKPVIVLNHFQSHRMTLPFTSPSARR
jgi:hypothetical protein